MINSSVRLVIFPGERVNEQHTTVGHIYVYVEGRLARSYDVAGGPPPGSGGKDAAGGHSRGPTPAGHYVLSSKEHHTTLNWPSSVVPWGAQIRERDGIVEYRSGGSWVAASGSRGRVTQAIVLWYRQSGRSLPTAVAARMAREMFYDKEGNLKDVWKENDFGQWSWNLVREGRRTPFYIHTTPEDEARPKEASFELQQSHGCLHIRPRDRDDMTAKNYLRTGVQVEVMSYGKMGPLR